MDRDATSQETDELSEILSSLRSTEFRDDPYPYYKQLRERAPVLRASDRWLLTRYRDCDAVLRDERWSQAPEELIMCLPDRKVSVDQSPVSTSDSPHNPGYLRGFLSTAFSSSALRQFQPRVQVIINELLDVAEQKGEVDLIEAFAHPLPALVVCELFGVPTADREVFTGWVADITRRVDIVTELSADEIARHDQARANFRDYFRGLIAERRARPGTDILSGLVAHEDDRNKLTEEELLDACIFILIAGHGAPTELFGTGMLALARNPDQLVRFHDDPDIAPTAVEELLRYDTPGQITPRVALADTSIDGQRIERGDIALVLLGAANRDPEAFPDPERLDLTRQPNRHLAFGQGPHYCVGAPVARLELRLAFTTLMRRERAIEVMGPPQWKDSLAIRGVARLPVSLRPR